ncbi:MAG: DUF3883 domain-containing protein [Treponema sp.]|nr:DUF3883 domain-containing protein [Treponema sp.]
MMETIEEAKRYIDKLVSEYKEDHVREQERDLLIAENNIEKRDIKGYHGREILELLQNADDAYQKSIELGEKPEDDLEVVITYKKNTLSITNSGTYFDKAGIKAIVQGNNSPKQGKYIGSKGTGFRSILNWADSVKILSGGFNVEFSKTIAKNFYDSIKDYPQVKKQAERNKNLYVPMLAVPQNMNGADIKNVTTIQIEIDEKQQDDDFSVINQINSIDLRSLLFLPNITKISIFTDSEEIVYKRTNLIIDKEKTQVTLEKIVSGETVSEEIFHLYAKVIEKAIKEKQDDEDYKDVLISIAIPQNYESFISECLYSFFPLLDTDSPFNCVMHGSYVLGDHRNTIVSSEENKFVAKEQIKYLIEIAKKYIAEEKYDFAYNILIPNNFSRNGFKFSMPFSKFGLEDFYLDLLCEEKIFKTVNEKNISINDSPMIFRTEYPIFFRGNSFEKLLVGFKSKETYDLFETLAKRKNIAYEFKEKDLCNIINTESEKWSVQQQVETFIWWNEANYSYCLPALLKTQNNNYLELDDACYFLLGDFNNIKIPSWVKVPSLKEEYQKELLKQSEKLEKIISYKQIDKTNPVARIISQQDIFPTIQFAYRDRSNIISAVNSSVEEYEQAIEFIKWLWDNYHSENDWMPPGKNKDVPLTYNFPNSNQKTTIDSEKLYFGVDYGNNLAPLLFDPSYESFPSISDLGLSEIDINEFKNFISKFGVKKFPEIQIQYIANLKPTYIAKYSFSNAYYFNLPYITNLDVILNKLSTNDVIRWIMQDPALFTNLSNEYAAEGHFKGQYVSKGRYYDITEKQTNIYNYILEVFNEASWIEIGDSRYSPRDVLQNFKTESKNNDKFSNFLPVFSIRQIENIAKDLECDYIRIRNIFEKFSFCNDVTELSSNAFYKLMLDIPNWNNFTESVEVSRAIYRALEGKKDVPLNFKQSINMEKFWKEGKVLAKYKGQLQFYKADLCYVPSTKILNKNEEYIIDKGPRTGNENFKTLFHCREYDKEYEIIPGSGKKSHSNDSFQAYFKDFLKYACAYKDTNANISKYIYLLSISLVSEIDIKQNDGKRLKITNKYECLRESVTSWYIIVPNSNFSVNEISEKIELIFTNIANTNGFESSKLGELFRAKNREDREFLIKKEFGSLNVIDSEIYQNEIKNNFITALKNLNDSLTLDDSDIDFENFFSIDNSQKLIKFLRNINTDLEELRNAGFEYAIDLIPYYKNQLVNFINSNKRKYKNALFVLAKQDENKQKSFLRDYYDFEDYTFDKYENSIYFDVNEIIASEFSEILNNPLVLKQSDCNAEDEYSVNYVQLNPQKLYEDYIANDDYAKILIYFSRKEEFENWLKKMEEKENSENQTINPYSELKNLVPTKKDISYQDESSSNNDSSSSRNSHGSFTRTGKEKKQRNQKILGNKGEYLIYNLLCDKYGEDNVYPKSEAFVDLGILKPGQANSKDYDLSYIDENNNEFFVEVKTGDSNSFYISPGELQFAQTNPTKYKLFIVFNLDLEEPNYVELPQEFWKNPNFRMKEIVESIFINF